MAAAPPRPSPLELGAEAGPVSSPVLEELLELRHHRGRRPAREEALRAVDADRAPLAAWSTFIARAPSVSPGWSRAVMTIAAPRAI